MTQADWLPYALPLKEPWQTSRGSTLMRCGRLLRLRSNDGRCGWGDCAPLPAFGIDETRASAFAEECAQLDLSAQRAGLPFAAWLSGRQPIADIAVNANLGCLQSVTREKLATACAEGFQVIKLKVGIGTLKEEMAWLENLAQNLPSSCRLRLDANGAWSNEEARTFLSACRDLPIEACEEPLREPELHDLARLQEFVPFAIALDESMEQLAAKLFHQPPIRRIVIKPARQGSLLASMEIALRARSVGMEVVVSSALESSCGLLACAHLAAAVAPRAVHGLATATWFSCDTGEAVSIHNGRLIMPGETGIGFRWAGESAAAFAGEC